MATVTFRSLLVIVAVLRQPLSRHGSRIWPVPTLKEQQTSRNRQAQEHAFSILFFSRVVNFWRMRYYVTVIGVCEKCHSMMELTRHHILPRSMGGGWENTNITLVCRPCHDELDAAVGVGKKPPLPPEHHRARRRAAEKRRKERRRIEAKLDVRPKRGLCGNCGSTLPKKQSDKYGLLCKMCQYKRMDEAIFPAVRMSLTHSRAH